MTGWLAGVLAGAAVLVGTSRLPAAARLGSGSGAGPRGRWRFVARLPVRSRPERAGPGEGLALVEALVAELATGCSLPTALGRTVSAVDDGPLRARLEQAASIVTLGGAPSAALAWATEGIGGRRLRPVAAACQVAETAGIPVAGVLEGVAATLRGELRARRQVAVALAGPRATARLLALLPLVGVALGTALGGDPLGVLLAGPAGWSFVVLGVALDVLGLRWTARLARSVEGG